MATQNPIESEGTYPLPEAQVDRFMLKVLIGYPRARRGADDRPAPARGAARSCGEALIARRASRRCRRRSFDVYVDPALVSYAVALATATREPAAHGLADLGDYIAFGASPRGPISLVQAARALALVRGRDYVLAEDIQRARQGRAAPPARPHVPGARRGGERRRDPRSRARGRARPADRPRPDAPPREPPRAAADRRRPARARADAGALLRALDVDDRPAGRGAARRRLPLRAASARAPSSRRCGRTCPGDDVRQIDWNVTARTGEPHVRVHLAERVLVTWLVLDTSPSMQFGTAERRKADVAEGVAIAVGHVATRRGNRLGVVTFGDAEPRALPPRAGARRAARAARARCARSPRRRRAVGATSLGEALAAHGRARAPARARRRRLRLPRPARLAPPLLELAAAARRGRGRDPRPARAGAARTPASSGSSTRRPGRQLRVDTRSTEAARALRRRRRRGAARRRARRSRARASATSCSPPTATGCATLAVFLRQGSAAVSFESPLALLALRRSCRVLRRRRTSASTSAAARRPRRFGNPALLPNLVDRVAGLAPPPAARAPAPRARGDGRRRRPAARERERARARRRPSSSRSTSRARWARTTSSRRASPPRAAAAHAFLDEVPDKYRVGARLLRGRARRRRAADPATATLVRQALARCAPARARRSATRSRSALDTRRSSSARATAPSARRRCSSSPTARATAAARRRRPPRSSAQRAARPGLHRSSLGTPDGVVEAHARRRLHRADPRAAEPAARCSRSRGRPAASSSPRATTSGCRRSTQQLGSRLGHTTEDRARSPTSSPAAPPLLLLVGGGALGALVPEGRREARCSSSLAVLVAAPLARASASAPAATNECRGLQVCVRVAGPWVVVPAAARHRAAGQFQLSCPSGYIVGGLDAELSDRAIDVSFPGEARQPRQPRRSTTSRARVFARALRGRGAARRELPAAHRLHARAAGGGGRAIADRRQPPSPPGAAHGAPRHARALTSGHDARRHSARAARGERLVAGSHASASTPAAADAGARSRRRPRARHRGEARSRSSCAARRAAAGRPRGRPGRRSLREAAR